jgi:quinoprotein glucose dehydrogenase
VPSPARHQIDLEKGEIGLHSTPTVVGDVVIVGSSFKEGFTVVTHNNTKGLVRAFDVRTGKQIWRFNTIPKPGEFGAETWEENSWSFNATPVWTQIADRGRHAHFRRSVADLRHLRRHARATICSVKGRCGRFEDRRSKRHFQFVHHPIWDMDMSSALP